VTHDSLAQMTVDAEIRVPLATAQLVRFDVNGPTSGVVGAMDEYHVDTALTPRLSNARACYNNRWSPHRYERLGKVYIVPPRETIQARSDGCSSQTSVLCRVKPEAMPTEFQWTDRCLLASLDIGDSNVRGLLLRLANELRHPGFASGILVELVVAQLGIELTRYYMGFNDSRASGLSGRRLKLIDERVQEVREAPTLNELAELCQLSTRQLTRGFRASRGYSIGNYVADSRIDHAKRMLLRGESVKAISYSLGFASPSAFCCSFRRATGLTPREFRLNTPGNPPALVRRA